MKPLLQKLTVSKDSSYLFERFESPFFETPLHFHEEFEIVLCDGGYGKKVIGYHTSEYFEDDLAQIFFKKRPAPCRIQDHSHQSLKS